MFSKKSRGAKVGRPRQNARNGGEMMLFKPPSLRNYELRLKQRFRFTAVAAVTNSNVSWTDLTDTILVATTAVAGIKLFQFVKVHEVEIWDDAAIGGNATLGLEFTNTDANQADERQVFSDTSLGIYPAHLRARPKKDSLASKWHGVSANNAFALTVTAGAIIDVVLSLRNQGAVGTAVQNALVGGVVGGVYYRGLDGLAIGGTNFPPPTGTLTI